MDLYTACCVLLSAISLFHVTEPKVSANNSSQGRRRRGGQQGAENDAVFVTYANNPFGSSFKFISRQNKTVAIDTGQRQQRAKRGVLHLYNMVKCATGCDPLSYKGYGCYCGFLGNGKPVDPIDRCCKRHDWCYNNAGCLPFFEYIVPYYWKCRRGRPLCAVEHGEFGGRDSCARRLCECDRVLSECLARQSCPSSRAFCYSSPWRLLQNVYMLF